MVPYAVICQYCLIKEDNYARNSRTRHEKAFDMLGWLPRVEKHLTLQGVLKVHVHSSDDNKPSLLKSTIRKISQEQTFELSSLSSHHACCFFFDDTVLTADD